MTLLVTLLAGVVALAAPQDANSVLLRYRPAYGFSVERDFQLFTRSVIGAAGAAAVRESAALGSMHQVASRGYGGQAVAHAGIDSLWLRVREAGDSWTEVTIDVGDTVWRQLEADDRLRLGAVRTSGGDGAGRLLEWLTVGVPGLMLPPERFAPGATWQGLVSVPIGVPGLPDGPWRETQLSITVRLDSITAMRSDTLVFTSLSGSATQPSLAGALAPVAVSVGVAGSVVWSTARSAYVVHAVRVRSATTLVGPDGTRVPASFETTLRARVRPSS